MEITGEATEVQRPADVLRWVQARVRAELDVLAKEVDTLRGDAAFQSTLEVAARFWMYSQCNCSLIARALPTATHVMGQRGWEKLGRKVCAGQRAIQVLAPMTGRGFPFLLVPVYDISQTEGRPPKTLDLSLPGETVHVVTLERAAAGLGIVLRPSGRRDVLGESRGGEIRVSAGLGGVERVSVIAHELAHELLHQRAVKRLPRAMEEAEAEATAHVVLRALGLPSTVPGYIAWQGGDGAAILRSLGRIQRAARRILHAGGLTTGAGSRHAGPPPRAR